MADDRIFQALASHDGPADFRDAFADDLFERLQRERRSAGGWWRTQLLLVAMLLVVLATITAVAIGSRLVKLPDRDAELPALAAIDCLPEQDSLPADLVLRADVRTADQSSGSRPTEELLLFADGTLVHGKAGASLLDESIPTARRLSPEGIAMVVGAVEESGLVARGCHLDLFDSTPLRGLSLRFDDGTVGTTDWGQYGGFTRMLSDAERTAAEALVASLEDLSWLPASAWIASSAEAQRPEEWVVTVVRLSETSEVGYEMPGRVREAPLVADVSAPGGGTLDEFGTEFRDPDIRFTEFDGTVHVQEGLVRRCALVKDTQALELADALDAAGAVTGNSAWWLADPPHFLMVQIVPNRWDAGDCARYLAGDRPPAELVLPTPAPASAYADPCSLLPIDVVEAVLPRRDDLPITTTTGREDHGVTYATCAYGNPEYSQSVAVLLRPGDVPVGIAGAIAKTWLGPDREPFEIGAARVWENECMTADVQSMCVRAAALWIDGTFVVVRFDRVLAGDARAVLDAIVPAMVESVQGGVR